MKICFPAETNNGLDTVVFNHFGSAPLFLMVDTETGAVTEVLNRDAQHEHGACQPVRALGETPVQAVVVGGIGGGALGGLSRVGIVVYKTAAPTVAQNLKLLQDGALERWMPGQTCGGHHHEGHTCGH